MNLFELFVKIGVDDQASNNLSKITDKLGNGLKKAAQIGTVAVSAAAAGIAALTKAAVDNYAEYEQLVGGAELMFGDAFKTVEKNAQEAYETVQMSQSEYLRQVNGFATGLKTALGGNEKAAADLAHKIVKAEADIIAATGNTAENVQNAFNGIMRSNFTMLDNLQIGITPTKEGFQEVIDKVNEWNEANGRATSYQLGNLADMQSALIDYIDMVGYSGYASAEAAGTISGSVASMKSAWSNLVTGIADENANLDALISNFVDSVGTAAENIIPRIEKALGGTGLLIERLSPIIIEKLPSLVETVVPSFLSAATQIVTAVADVLPELIEVLVPILAEQAPIIIKAGIELSKALASGLLQALADPEVVSQIFNAVTEIGAILINRRVEMVKAAISFISSLGLGLVEHAEDIIPAVQEFIGKAVAFVKKHASTFIDAAVEIISIIGEGISEKAENLVSKIEEFVSKIVSFISDKASILVDGAITIVESIGRFIVDNAEKILGAVTTFVNKVVEFITNRENLITIASVAIKFIEEIAVSLINNISNILPTLIQVVVDIAEMLINPDVLNPLIDAALHIITTLALGLTEAMPELTSTLIGLVNYIVEILTDDNVLDDLIDAALAIILALADFIVDVLPELVDASAKIINKLVEYLLESDNLSKIGQAALDIVLAISEALIKSAGNLVGGVGELINQIVSKIESTDWGKTGRNIVDAIWTGLKDMWEDLVEWLDENIGNIVGGFEDTVNTIKRLLGLDTETSSTVKTQMETANFAKSTTASNQATMEKYGITINQNIYSQPQSAADLAQETIWEANSAWISRVAR